MLYLNCKVRNRKWTSLNILLKVINEIQHEMILSFLIFENLSTYLVKNGNGENFPQQLISQWIAVYLLSSLILRGISPVDRVTMGVEIQERMSWRMCIQDFRLLFYNQSSIIVGASQLYVGVRGRRWRMIMTERKKKRKIYSFWKLKGRIV